MMLKQFWIPSGCICKIQYPHKIISNMEILQCNLDENISQITFLFIHKNKNKKNFI